MAEASPVTEPQGTEKSPRQQPPTETKEQTQDSWRAKLDKGIEKVRPTMEKENLVLGDRREPLREALGGQVEPLLQTLVATGRELDGRTLAAFWGSDVRELTIIQGGYSLALKEAIGDIQNEITALRESLKRRRDELKDPFWEDKRRAKGEEEFAQEAKSLIERASQLLGDTREIGLRKSLEIKGRFFRPAQAINLPEGQETADQEQTRPIQQELEQNPDLKKVYEVILVPPSEDIKEVLKRVGDSQMTEALVKISGGQETDPKQLTSESQESLKVFVAQQIWMRGILGSVFDKEGRLRPADSKLSELLRSWHATRQEKIEGEITAERATRTASLEALEMEEKGIGPLERSRRQEAEQGLREAKSAKIATVNQESCLRLHYDTTPGLKEKYGGRDLSDLNEDERAEVEVSWQKTTQPKELDEAGKREIEGRLRRMTKEQLRTYCIELRNNASWQAQELLNKFFGVYRSLIKPSGDGTFNWEFRRLFLFGGDYQYIRWGQRAETMTPSEKRDEVAELINQQLQDREAQQALAAFKKSLGEARSLSTRLSQEAPLIQPMLEELQFPTLVSPRVGNASSAGEIWIS